MLLAVNEVLYSRSEQWRRRILFNEAHSNTIVWIDIDKAAAWPMVDARARILELLDPRNGISREELEQPRLDENLLSDAERRLYDARWAAIATLVKEVPAIYIAKKRGPLVAQAVKDGHGSRPFIYRSLRLFWQGGLTKEALLPRFRHCGAPGIARIPDGATEKRGRPRSVTPGTGVNITAVHLQNMRQAWAASPVGRDGKGLDAAYNWMLTHRYSEHVELVPRKVGKLSVQDHDAVPTEEQFRYRFFAEHSREELERARLGNQRFEKQYKRLLSGTLSQVRGPGTRFYIDATILDIYCVSRLNRNRLCGRPTLYLVVDDFSRLIVGMYLGLEPPCWVGALMALLNTCLPKVPFCARYGIQIDEWQWPTAGIPLHLMGDRGELESRQATLLSSGLRSDVENAGPYDGPAKGVGERAFGTVQTKFGPYHPGYVDPEFAGRDAPDYRLRAAMNLAEITRTMIFAVLWTNTRVVRGYDAAPELVTDNTPFIPVKLWQWGVENLRCDVRHYDFKYLCRYLLPVHEGRLQRKAVQFLPGLYYQSEELFRRAWYFSAQGRKESMSLAYNPSDMSSLFVLPSQEREAMYAAEQTVRSARRFGGFALSEIMAGAKAARVTNRAAFVDYRGLRAGFERGIVDTVAEAKRRAREEHDASISKAERLRNIRENRAEELADFSSVPGEVLSSTEPQAMPTEAADPEVEMKRRTLDELERLRAERKRGTGD